jgi:hypothetical protein
MDYNHWRDLPPDAAYDEPLFDEWPKKQGTGERALFAFTRAFLFLPQSRHASRFQPR